MSCYICGVPMESMRLDPRDNKTRPCSTCESIIAEMVNERDDEYYLAHEDEEFNEEDVDVAVYSDPSP